MPLAIDSPKARRKPRKPAPPPEQDDLTAEKRVIGIDVARFSSDRSIICKWRRRELWWVFEEEGEG